MKQTLVFTSSLAILCLFPLAIESGQNRENSQPKPPSHPHGISPQPTSVSLINLIATPERYDGRMVSVVGFLAVESEDVRLYLSQEDYRHNIMENGIFVDANKEVTQDMESKDLHFGQLIGVFKQKGLPLHFPGGAGDGGITDIRACFPLPELTDSRPRRLKDGAGGRPTSR